MQDDKNKVYAIAYQYILQKRSGVKVQGADAADGKTDDKKIDKAAYQYGRADVYAIYEQGNHKGRIQYPLYGPENNNGDKGRNAGCRRNKTFPYVAVAHGGIHAKNRKNAYTAQGHGMGQIIISAVYIFNIRIDKHPFI
jgi:hypothetical protein